MTLVAALPAAVGTPLDVEACGPRGSQRWLCRLTVDLTDSIDAGRIGNRLSPWISALLVVLAAALLARLVRVVIRRVVHRLEQGATAERIRRFRGGELMDTSASVPTVRRHQRAVTIGAGLRSISAIVIWVAAIIGVLGVLGIELGPLLAGAGLMGVALGFGAQNLLRDLIAGTFMIFEDQFGVGDVIDAGVASGTVEQVSLRTTRLRDVEGVVWHVPNGEIRRVGNKSQQWSRAVLDVPVAYDTDIDLAQQVIKAAADALWNDERWARAILSEPEVWGVESLGGDAVTIRLVVKTVPLEQWKVARELRARLKMALDEAAIALPASLKAPGPAQPPAPSPAQPGADSHR